TAYTPYQPEASQGSLQAFFEYQSLICQLTGLDVSNASLYEGGTAVSEAAFMSMRVTGRHKKVAIAETVHPDYRQVLETYFHSTETEVVTLPMIQGSVDLNRAAELVDDQTACLIFQHPNFFGGLEDARELCEIARRTKALSVVSFDPMSLGILKRPGDYGADIGVAEGQPLGIPLQYGGPYLGILACRKDYMRKMPGRLITTAKDRDGRDCYVLGLQTREQHIRRDKATSNICTNQGLLALRATVFMATLGPQGFREAATLCCQKAHYAHERFSQIHGLAPLFERPFFKEFGLRVVQGNASDFVQRAAEAGFDIGPSLDRFPLIPESLRNSLLIAVTESRTREEIDRLADALAN
ncbi:MAG: aminomethyl-transferring glycine dehydrogenase subunit GcvPA, partial [Planctomycetaceae bacterium]|nr:aminomethyl-transferring glycine dehydrogenase subunit GcvPA [Planctomycetaceae bacterium]